VSEERNMIESGQIFIDMSLRLPFIILILQLRRLQRSVLSVDTEQMLRKLISLLSETSRMRVGLKYVKYNNYITNQMQQFSSLLS